MDQVYMHLTNYSLNKFNKEGFVAYDEDNEESGDERAPPTLKTAPVTLESALHTARNEPELTPKP
jgi:hypothetical protein